MDHLRLLIVSPLAGYLAPHLAAAFEGCYLNLVTAPDQLDLAVRGRPRYDAVLLDLTWNDPVHEWSFDGLDALERFREVDRVTTVVVAAQGHSFEEDHLRESSDPERFPEVKATIYKSAGLPAVTTAVEAVVTGRPPPTAPALKPKPPLHRYFSKGRGLTASRLAAAVASGRAANYDALASVASVAPDTANKLVSYLAPIILAREEAPASEPVTQAAVYRWCGEHARYLLSWERRNNPAGHSVISRWIP